MYLDSIIKLQLRWKLLVWPAGLHSDRRPAGDLKFGALLKYSMQGFYHPSHTAFQDFISSSYDLLHQRITDLQESKGVQNATVVTQQCWSEARVPCLNIDLQGFSIYKDHKVEKYQLCERLENCRISC